MPSLTPSLFDVRRRDKDVVGLMTQTSPTLKYNNGQGTSRPSFPQKTSDRLRRDVVANLMCCVVCPFPLTVLSAARLPCVLQSSHLPALFFDCYVLVRVSPLEIDTTPDVFLSMAPIPSIFFFSVTETFLRYNLSSRHKIVPKNCTSFFWNYLQVLGTVIAPKSMYVFLRM